VTGVFHATNFGVSFLSDRTFSIFSAPRQDSILKWTVFNTGILTSKIWTMNGTLGCQSEA
jgi:hypothetical protein